MGIFGKISNTFICTECKHASTGHRYWYSIIERYLVEDRDPIPAFCSESCINKWCLLRIPDFFSWLETRETGKVLS